MTEPATLTQGAVFGPDALPPVLLERNGGGRLRVRGYILERPAHRIRVRPPDRSLWPPIIHPAVETISTAAGGHDPDVPDDIQVIEQIRRILGPVAAADDPARAHSPDLQPAPAKVVLRVAVTRQATA